MYERFTDRAKKVVELAMREALGLGHNYISTEHILLGLIREGEGVAAQTLVLDLDLTLHQVRQAVIQRLNGYSRPVVCPACGKEINDEHTPNERRVCMRKLRERQVGGQDG